MYLVIIIGDKFWFTSTQFARRGIADFSSGRGIIADLTGANRWSVDIKIVDDLEYYQENFEEIKV